MKIDNNMKIHHLGYAVKSLNSSIKEFVKLGFSKKGKKIVDEDRKVVIQFVELDEYSIELIAPLNDASPVTRIVEKCGDTPYHMCFVVRDIHKEIERRVKDNYLIIEQPENAPAINGKKVAFLFKKGIGVVEFIEEDNRES